MHLSELLIRDFRCIEKADLQPAPGINLIVGDNASGKSTLLEAIFYLGRGRSFRKTSASRLIREGTEGFVLRSSVESEVRRTRRIGIHRTGSGQRVKLDAEHGPALFDLISALPLQVIDPNLHRLLEEGPEHRRRFLDWGVFHVEHDFFPAWRRYRRALRQRNGALRTQQAKTSVIAWDKELMQSALIVDACRRGYIKALLASLPEFVETVLGTGEVSIDYNPGWSRHEDLGAALARTLDTDQRAGYTHVGPHRADMRVRVGHASARDWVSRGQQKLLTAVLLLCQAALLHRRRGIRPVLLIDDLAAELGGVYRGALMRAVQQVGGQCFLTFLDEGLVPDGLAGASMFHVEHGVVRRAG